MVLKEGAGFCACMSMKMQSGTIVFNTNRNGSNLQQKKSDKIINHPSTLVNSHV